MRYPKPLVKGVLIKRYMRFLADVRLETGEVVTAHCTNSGSMKSCLEPGADVYVSTVDDLRRKTRFTWEMIRINGHWVGINTSIPNLLAYEFLQRDLIPGLEGYTDLKREVKYGDSRLDILARNENETCFIEVKNVTLKEGERALFPDAVTLRGQKHLQTLMELNNKGLRAVMIYMVQRVDVRSFGPASAIDPRYAELLKMAVDAGVEVFPVQVRVHPEGADFFSVLPFEL